MSSKPLPEVNIGLVGHVDHGKTTLTKALSGQWTDKHSEELRRGITIRIGYADILVRECEECGKFTVKDECECGGESKINRSISLVDAPGHETLMANVLSGASIMDGALLLVSATEECPQPQTREHLEALNIAGVENIVIVQNKIDLVSKEEALENYKQIKEFVKGSIAEDAPIIPISAQHSTNIDNLLQAVQEKIPTPDRDNGADPQMLIARSFDINKPETPIKDIKGGVVGGSVIKGSISKGDEVEIRPGRKDGKKWKPIHTKIMNIISGGESVDTATPGGLTAVETQLDPALTKSDNLAGNVLGKKDKLPEVIHNLTMDVTLMDRAVGSEEEKEVANIREKEPLLLNVGTAKTSGAVTQAGGTVKVALRRPVCVEKGERVAISRRIGSRWRLVGYGIIK